MHFHAKCHNPLIKETAVNLKKKPNLRRIVFWLRLFWQTKKTSSMSDDVRQGPNKEESFDAKCVSDRYDEIKRL